MPHNKDTPIDHEDASERDCDCDSCKIGAVCNYIVDGESVVEPTPIDPSDEQVERKALARKFFEEIDGRPQCFGGNLHTAKTEQAYRLADIAFTALRSPVPRELRELSERAVSGPWAWEQCGDKSDDPVVGLIFPPDDEDGSRPYSGEVTNGTDDDYRMTIALEWPSCDGVTGSSNAAFAVAAVNFVRHLIQKERSQ